MRRVTKFGTWKLPIGNRENEYDFGNKDQLIDLHGLHGSFDIYGNNLAPKETGKITARFVIAEDVDTEDSIDTQIQNMMQAYSKGKQKLYTDLITGGDERFTYAKMSGKPKIDSDWRNKYYLPAICTWNCTEPFWYQANTQDLLRKLGYTGLTNLIWNPSGENNADGWWFYDHENPPHYGGSPGVTTSSARSYFGADSISGSRGGNDGLYFAPDPLPAVTAGKKYLFTAYVNGDSLDGELNGVAAIAWRTASNPSSGSEVSRSTNSFTFLEDGWVRATVIGTAPATATHAELLVYRSGAVGNYDLFIDGAMFYEGDILVDYFDGTINGSEWTGTAHASTSTQPTAVEILTSGEPIDDYWFAEYTIKKNNFTFDIMNLGDDISQRLLIRLVPLGASGWNNFTITNVNNNKSITYTGAAVDANNFLSINCFLNRARKSTDAGTTWDNAFSSLTLPEGQPLFLDLESGKNTFTYSQSSGTPNLKLQAWWLHNYVW